MFYKNSKFKKAVGTLFLLISSISFSTNLAANLAANSIDDLIKEEMTNRHILGLQLAVVKDNQLVTLSSYGSTDVKDENPVTDDLLFSINSMTKAFTGTLIVKLEAEGKLSLSDAIGKHLSDLPKAWQAITIQHLLSHTSGLPNILTGNLVEMVGDGTDEGAWHAVQKHPMKSTINERFSYNQLGYALLGKIIEKYTAQTYSAAVKSLLVKTGMHETAEHSFTIETSTNTVPQYVYSKSGHKQLPLNFPRILWPAAGMNASAKELAKFVIAVQSDKYFSSEQKAKLWAPNVLNNGKTAGFNSRENGYAAGWQVIDRELHPAVSASGGNAVTLIVYPQENLSIIVLTNLLGSLPIEFVDDIAAYYR